MIRKVISLLCRPEIYERNLKAENLLLKYERKTRKTVEIYSR